MIALVLAGALSSMPAEEHSPCGATDAENAKYDAAALELAKTSFPDARVTVSCIVWGSGFGGLLGRAVVRFSRVKVEAGGVTFFMDLEAEAKGSSKWALITPVRRETLAGIAAKILAEPMTKLLSKPVCLVGRDHEAVGYLCRDGLDPEEFANTPSLGMLPEGETSLEFLAFDAKQCPRFALENFSLPLSKVTTSTRGWCSLRAKGSVRSRAAALDTKDRADSWLRIVRTSAWTAELHTPGQRDDETIVESQQGGTSPCPPLPKCK